MCQPISPHLTVYKPQITSTLSIFHRATGAILGLAVGVAGVLLPFLSLNLVVSSGPTMVFFLDGTQFLLSHWNLFVLLGEAIGFTLVFSFYYHSLNGVRHLIWDRNRALSMEAVTRGGYLVLGLALLLSVGSFGLLASFGIFF